MKLTITADSDIAYVTLFQLLNNSFTLNVMRDLTHMSLFDYWRGCVSLIFYTSIPLERVRVTVSFYDLITGKKPDFSFHLFLGI